MEKHSMNVNAYRTETSFTTKGELVSTVELIVPAEEVQILREMHSLQEIRPVAYLLSVAHRETGEHRELNLHSKGSKMKDFVPVVILTKRAESSDDLNSLFDASAFELTLNVEVAKDEAPLYDEQEGEEGQPAPAAPEPIVAGVLNAPKEVLALPAGEDVQDAEFTTVEAPAEAQDTPEQFVARCDLSQLSILMEAAGYDVTDWDDAKRTPDQEAAEWRELLLKDWVRVEGTGGWAMVKDQLANPLPAFDNGEVFEGEDMPFGPEDKAEVKPITTESEAEGALRMLEACDRDQLGRLAKAANITLLLMRFKAPSEAALTTGRLKLLENWHKLEGTDVLAQVKAELARNPEGGDAA